MRRTAAPRAPPACSKSRRRGTRRRRSAKARKPGREARQQVGRHEEGVKGQAGRADAPDRGAGMEREARARAAQRWARLEYEARVATAVLSGTRGLLDYVTVSLARAEQE